MKYRFLITAICLFWTTISFAQWMPDSTVRVGAYWDLGDVVEYQVKSQSVRIEKDGTETITKSASEKRIFEVIQQTGKSYVLQTSYKDVNSSEIDARSDASTLKTIIENAVIKTKTDKLGAIEGITNVDEFKENMNIIAENAVDLLFSKLDKKGQRDLGMTKEQLIKYYKEAFSSEEVAIATCTNDVVPLLQFHGGRYKIGDVYETKQDVDNVFGTNAIEGDLSFWVDMEDSDSTFVVLRTYLELGGEKMLDFMLESTVDLIKQNATGEDVDKAIKNLYEVAETSNMAVTMQEYTTTVVHLDSGWTTNWYYDRNIKITSDEGLIREIKDSQEVEMIIDEKTE